MIAEATKKVEARENLSRSEANAAMEELLSGRVSDSQIVALLAALRIKGETVEELVGFATAMRHHAQPIFDSSRAPQGMLVDTDRKSTRLNSSHGYISYAVFCLKKKKAHCTARLLRCSAPKENRSHP